MSDIKKSVNSYIIRTLLVDERLLVCQAIKILLKADTNIEIIGEATSGEEAIIKADELKPDLVIIDFQMGGIGGVEAIRVIKRRSPATKILVLSSCEQPIYFNWLLDVGGVSGYLTKDSNIEEIKSAIQVIFSGKDYMSASLANKLKMEKEEFDKINTLKFLSEKELQIVFMIVFCEKISQIASKLHICPKTVNTYRYRIYEKLNVSSDVELVHLAIKLGLVQKYELN